MKYLVEIGRYKGKYKLVKSTKSFVEALRIYKCYNVYNGYKKRLVLQIDSKVYKNEDGVLTKQKESKFYILTRYIS